jgi:small neutral amino acid transporter SnatA (MarC family)
VAKRAIMPVSSGRSHGSAIYCRLRRPSAAFHGAWAAALTGAMVATAATLVAADRLQRLVGERAMRAVERLMGLLLTAVAVEMLLTGIRDAAMQIAK